MPPQSKPARVKFLDVPPTADETAAEPVKHVRKFRQQKIDPATLNKHQPDASAEREGAPKARTYRAVVFNNCVHARDGSLRFSYGCYCTRTNRFITSAGRRDADLLNLPKLIQRMNRRCGHNHTVVAPFPLNKTKRPVIYNVRLSMRR